VILTDLHRVHSHVQLAGRLIGAKHHVRALAGRTGARPRRIAHGKESRVDHDEIRVLTAAGLLLLRLLRSFDAQAKY
jgi:hypothetical protein